MKNHIKGIAASPGITIGKAYHLTTPKFVIEKKTVTDFKEEINRLNQALLISKKEIENIKEETRERLGEEHAEIFSAHLLMLEDPELIGQVKKKIKLEYINAEFALNEIKSLVINIFKNIDNQYTSERAVDFQDVIDRIMAHLLNIEFSNPSLIHEEVVIIADELSPSHTAQLNKEFIKGFVTNSGGYTSHSAIIARSLELPAVVGTKSITSSVQQDDLVIIDGNKGIILINPTADEIQLYKEKQKKFEEKRKVWKRLKNEPTFTKDGYPIELFANINTPQDINNVLNNGGEGIGLYRTEYLYMDKDELPTEDEQFEAYKSVLMQMGEKPVIVRTLDVGGDKEIDYLNLPSEYNPFLGFRAIRFCLENEDVFRPQLRALLRASIYGNLKIMFPMITTLEELRQAKELLFDEIDKLECEGTKVSDQIEIGMMVETPSTAIIAKQFAKEVDFFSIGTNDLIQYTMAADRMNEQVSYLYQPYHPAILNLVHNVIEAAHEEGKWVCMCGEMAGDPIAVPILLALGLEKLSMSSRSILPIRSQLRDLSKEKLLSYREKLLAMGTTKEVIDFMKRNL